VPVAVLLVSVVVIPVTVLRLTRRLSRLLQAGVSGRSEISSPSQNTLGRHTVLKAPAARPASSPSPETAHSSRPVLISQTTLLSSSK
jgi:hypothetical protein